MLNFTFVAPQHIPADQRMRLRCAAASCNEVVIFCDASVWTWMEGDRFHTAAFCSQEHALMSMNPMAMGRA